MGRVGLVALWIGWMVGLGVAGAGQESQNPHAPVSPNLTPLAAMPSDPTQVLAEAARLNGLRGPGLKPWHIKATYEKFDEAGGSKGAGAYEEWWASDKQYKRSYVSADFTQTDYATPKGLFRVGEQKWPVRSELMVRVGLIEPLPDPSQFHEFHITRNDAAIDKLKLACVSLTYSVGAEPEKLGLEPNFFPSYCFASDQPLLRFAHPGNLAYDVTYNAVARFQGHYLARQLVLLEHGKVVETVKLDLAEELRESDGWFTPPADAVAVGPASLPHSSTSLVMIKYVPPNYIDKLREERVSGRVNTQVTIGKDGRVVNATLRSGSKKLAATAIDSIRQWVFRPFVFLGEPVEVEIEVETNFNIGR